LYHGSKTVQNVVGIKNDKDMIKMGS